MNSVFTTYKSTIEMLTSRVFSDVLEANNTGKTNVSREDLETLFTLLNSHAESSAMEGWEAVRKSIESNQPAKSAKTSTRTKRK